MAGFDNINIQILPSKVRQYLPPAFIEKKHFCDPQRYQDYLLYENYLDEYAYRNIEHHGNSWIY